MAQNGTRATGPRCIALVGPFQSGKTTLLEAILARTGAIQRQGTVEAGNTVGDASKEARHHQMSVELSVATTNFMGDSYTFIDCPGSVEFVHDMRAALPAVDAAVVVCEAGREEGPAAAAHPARARRPEDSALPVPQQDRQGRRHASTTRSRCCSRPRAASCCCGRSRPSPATSSPASSISRSSAPSSTRSTRRRRSCRSKATTLDREKTARFSMLETLADHDDELMEQLLERHPAAARQGVRRSRQGAARRPGRARC